MAKITALRTIRGRQRLNVFLDGKCAFSLEAELAAKEGLRTGQEISDGYVETLASSDKSYRCLNAALRLLDYRPRSESELRERLQRLGFDGDYIAPVLARLKEQGLIDDLAFARFWVENRESFRPRSARMVRHELRQKGLSEESIAQALADLDEEESAYRAGLRRGRRLTHLDEVSFRKKLIAYLLRRGFPYEVVNSVVERAWQELRAGGENIYESEDGR